MKALALIIAVLALIAVPAAQAGKVTVSGSYDGTYIDLTICGTGNKAVAVRVIAPGGSVQNGQAQARGLQCFDWNDGFTAFGGAGTYTIEVGNLQGHSTSASTTVTVP